MGAREGDAIGTAALDVEISVASTNNRALLERCLASLPRACDGLRWHATVIDNASGDGTSEVVAKAFPWARLIRNKRKRGFSANHNEALKTVLANESARYVLIIHEDLELGPDSVKTLVELCDAQPDVGAAGPLIVGVDGAPHSSFRAFPSVGWSLRSSFWPKHQPGSPQDSGWLDGPCTLVRVESLQQVGLLDERFFIFFEDVDFGLRLHEAGWRSELVERAQVVHHSHGTVGKPESRIAMERQFVRSRFLFLRKHRGTAEAELVAWSARLSFLLRAAKAFVLRRQALAAILLDLALYNPRRPLTHELRGDVAAR